VDVDLVGGYCCIVHSCPIVEYFTESYGVAVFRKNGLSPFPVFALKLGLEKCPEMDQKFCLEKIGFFVFFVFLCFCVVILA
jgi:hypothetical protein